MTTINRRPLSWDRRELDHLQVRIRDYTARNASGFFEMDGLPARTTVSPLIVDHNRVETNKRRQLGMYERNFFARLRAVRDAPEHGPSYEELAENVLRMVGFDRGDRTVHRRFAMPLSFPDKHVVLACPDWCFTTLDKVPLLLVQKELDVETGRLDEATAHFVGQAIGALRYTNDNRRQGAPMFHKIRVTRQLLDAVQDGVPVDVSTTVERFIPASTSASPPRGLEALSCRRNLFRCLEACRLLLKRIAPPPAPDCSDLDEDSDMEDP
ncbi:hypothetical protein C8T65DRAFT_741196 [Cerioporus squamosus]|nr:hypothetical protein C8T65DRAFT_741196 [Cerioporus squamosus]